MTTPTDLNFRMPAEWTRHACTFMEWPVNQSIWPEHIELARRAYAAAAKAIAVFEPVFMLARPEELDRAAQYCGPTVRPLAIPHDDSWMRDNGPTFVVDDRNRLAGINWRFNAWGGKTGAWDDDDRVAPTLLQRLGIPCFNAPMVLEGGSIHVDGEGTLLVTAECLLNRNRNPHLTKAEIAALLGKYLNIQKVIWLKRGLAGDETDGHVDNVACFARPGAVLIQSCDDPADPNFAIYRENRRILAAETDARGRNLTVIPIGQPPPTYSQSKRLPMSYINFYLVNGGLIFPVFGGPCRESDEQARLTLEQAFPGRKVVGVDGMTIIKGGGNIHCITQQMPVSADHPVMEEGFWDARGTSGRGADELQLVYG
ncbi:agmatine deiminase [Hydrogenispora ethanolica]|uniref:Putative agmatine deiminase n=1 Tax=Hydrogenispora ethanolica TaxID=1082276 RepID=A0A4R1RU21_HYDET|nr:agmatine deiminase family protein [Hydrogenispora ethanolica]TCL70053.1 agmatine deiminase [Hydrogenispora ethanolica]